ncbi:MAG: protein phosphatase 2C domain-containing protein [Gammaproteobacteria bacterium]|nr:protein phosphatase 2C domain-containing protein [Gammaproteobacteria bacterium]
MNLFERFRNLLVINKTDDKQFSEISVIGHRQINQDFASHLFTSQGKLFLIADGLGGHKGGELASRYFCEALLIAAKTKLKQLNKSPDTTLVLLAEMAATAMSERIALQHPGMNAHTTCAVCWLSADNTLTTLHIGDSRIYWFTARRLIWHSRDHSVVQTLVDSGIINEKQMGTHPTQNALTRSIAVGKPIKPSFKTHQTKLAKGDALLLCTDGFWEMITQNEIISLAKSKKPAIDLNRWVNTAVNRSKPHSDNVTVQLYLV